MESLVHLLEEVSKGLVIYIPLFSMPFIFVFKVGRSLKVTLARTAVAL